MTRVLSVDVGGTNVKVLASGESEPRRTETGPNATAAAVVDEAKKLAEGWVYDVVSIGIPAPVHGGRVVHDPVNLGKGWAGFDFEQAFGKPTKVTNDAAMQALGSYEGGRMLFLGLGTGLGSTLIADGILEPMELGHLPYKKATYEDYIGEAARLKVGRKRWEKRVSKIVAAFTAALEPDYVVLGGGNAKRLSELPAGARLGDNANAFKGGFRLWEAHAAG